MIWTLSQSICWHRAPVGTDASASPADKSHADFIDRSPCRAEALVSPRFDRKPSIPLECVSCGRHRRAYARTSALVPGSVHPQSELSDQRRPLPLFLVDVGGILLGGRHQ